MTATTFYVPKNNATTTLNGGIDDAVTTVVVTDGSVFPGSFPYPVMCGTEIMIVTNRDGNSLTVTRGAEDTSAVPHLTAATIEMVITAGFISTLNTAVNALENSIGADEGIASLDEDGYVVEQPASISNFIEGTPTEDLQTKVPSSEWAHDHQDATIGVHGVASGAIAGTGDIPTAGTTPSTQAFGDTAAGGSATTWSKNDHKHAMPANPVTAHEAASDPHTGYVLESANYAVIAFIIDGAGSSISTGVKGFVEVPFACTILAATLLADQSGSIVVDVWKDTYANYPPTDADTITSATPPTITTATKSQNSTLTAWTTAISAGDILGFNVDSCTTITRVTVSLKVRKT